MYDVITVATEHIKRRVVFRNKIITNRYYKDRIFYCLLCRIKKHSSLYEN